MSGRTDLFERIRRLASNRLLVVLTVLALVATACSSDSADGSTTTTGGDSGTTTTAGDDGDTTTTTEADSGEPETLVIGMGFSPRSLWANSSTTQQEINISEQINEKLIEFGPDGQFEPRLAKSWEQLDDTTLELKLEEGVTFTNGEPFNAESAAFSVDVMLNSFAYGTFTSAVSGTEVIDDYTLHIKTAVPTGLHMAALAVGSFQYPMEYFAEVGEEEFGMAPIGTGPYMLEEWVIGEEVRLTVNPDYWYNTPDIEKVIFRSIPEEASRLAALETGEIGLLLDLPLDAADRIEANPDLQVLGRAGNRLYGLTLSTLSDTPLVEPEVRQAIKYAIDVQEIIDGPLQGRAVALADQRMTPAYFGFDPDREPIEHDPDLARQMLADAGYPDGFSVTFKYPSGRYTKDAEVSQVIAAQLAEVGIEVEQEVLEPGTFLDQLNALELNDMFFSGTLPPPDAHYVYFQNECEWRYAYYCREDVDALIEAGTQTVDVDERMDIYNQIRAIFDEDPPQVNLYVTEDLYGATSALSGFTPWGSQFTDVREFELSG